MIFDLEIKDAVLFVINIVIGFTIHEYAHARVAAELGDETPREQNRLTLNPIAHISMVGFVMILFAGFGWAKPVQIDAEKYKNPRLGYALVAVAGPLSNLLFACLAAGLFRLLYSFSVQVFVGGQVFTFVMRFFLWATWINVMLGVFNLLPIPPLDGSRLIHALVPSKYESLIQWYFRIGSYALLAIIVATVVFHVSLLPILPVTRVVSKWLLGT
jgi:Zn-dependent protease